MSRNMYDYWSNFAKNGDPNVGSKVDVMWPKFDAGLQNALLRTPVGVMKNLLKTNCDFWDRVGYRF